MSNSAVAEVRETSERVESEIEESEDIRSWISGYVSIKGFRAVSDKVYDIETEDGGSVRKHVDHIVGYADGVLQSLYF